MVLALGFNLVYIVVKNKKTTDGLFFIFLELINYTEKSISKMEQIMKDLLPLGVQLDFLQNASVNKIKGIFGKDANKVFNFLNSVNINEKAKKLKQNEEKYIKIISLSPPKRINNLQFLALITAIYCFYVLICAPYEDYINNFNTSLILVNIVFIITGVILVLLDITSWNRIISVIISALCILFSILIIAGSRNDWHFIISFNKIFPSTILYHNYWITSLICFGSFLLYILFSILGTIISQFFYFYIYFSSYNILKMMKIFRKHDSQIENAMIESLNFPQQLQNININFTDKTL